MKLKNIIFILIVVILISLLITINKDSKGVEVQKKPVIAVSTFALYDITKHLVKDTAKVILLLPLGVDVHSYRPTPKQTVLLHDSDLVIYSGVDLEPWCRNFIFVNNVLDISKYVYLRKTSGSIDPHYWLDIDNMIKATEVIDKEIVKLLPKNEKFYSRNKDTYIQALKNLDLSYKKQLSSCKKKTIVVNHNAYSYLSKRYNFKVLSLSGFAPEAEPNAKRIISLIKYIKKHALNVLFFESFESDKAIKNIATELDIRFDSLQPLGNITADEAQQQFDYSDIMRQNLKKISNALECK